MLTNATNALLFAELLNEKFKDDNTSFTVKPGIRYDKIVVTNYGQSSAFAFVDADGSVLKADSWTRPAKGVRYATVERAAAAADVHGSFLYRR